MSIINSEFSFLETKYFPIEGKEEEPGRNGNYNQNTICNDREFPENPECTRKPS
jgi:hypothetical protein